MGPLTRWPLHPLLFAAYAVLFVYAANSTEVLPRQVLRPLGFAVLAGALVLLIAALVLRSPRRGAVVASAVVVTFALLGHAASLLGEAAGGAVPDLVMLGGGLAIILLAVVYAARARGSLPTVTAALNAFALALVALTLLTILPNETSRAVRASEGEAVSVDLVAQATQVPDRDIFFILFDRYGSDWSLKQRFGVDNDIYESLESRGFQVIPGARTNYRATDFSIATILNMRLLDDLTTRVGRVSKDRTPARELVGRHEVGKFLRANGYRYYHLSGWYEPTYDNPIADEVLRHGKTPEFDAVLREATALPAIERLAGLLPQDDPFRIRHAQEALFTYRQLLELADSPHPGRKFVFAHVLQPHPPYVFDAQGNHVPKATVLEKGEDGVFEPQLRYTNKRMLEIVDRLLDRPEDERPIIVITGDEGPFLCGDIDCVDRTPETYGIRFGTLRAYYLPGLDYTVPPDDTGVNIFRMLFREYFGADLPDLPNRSYDWPDNDHLYDFRDITDELPLPGG